MRVVRFFIKLLIFVIVAAVFVKAGLFFFDGYSMYKNALEEEGLEQRVENVRSSEDFVGIDSISEDFLTAIVCIEDRTFREHNGYNVKSFVRAVVSDIKSRSFSEGGSTITQQAAKNLCFSHEKSLSRKVAELLLAIKLERTYTKDEILELYVNIIYYGDGYTGILAASEGYFGKKPYGLTFNEATLLAGLPQAPSAYALSTHSDKAYARQQAVIDAMVDCFILTPQEAEERLKETY